MHAAIALSRRNLRDQAIRPFERFRKVIDNIHPIALECAEYGVRRGLLSSAVLDCERLMDRCSRSRRLSTAESQISESNLRRTARLRTTKFHPNPFAKRAAIGRSLRSRDINGRHKRLLGGVSVDHPPLRRSQKFGKRSIRAFHATQLVSQLPVNFPRNWRGHACATIAIESIGSHFIMFGFIKRLFGSESIGAAMADPRSTIGQTLSLPISTELARRNSTVVSCCNVVARLVAQIPFETDDRHAQQILDNPNQHQTPYEFKHGIAFDTALTGNAFVRGVRGPGGRIEMLAPLDPERVRVGTDSIGAPLYTNTSSSETFGVADVMHVRDGGGHKLLAPSRLESGGTRIRILLAADELIVGTFSKGIHLQYTVSSDNPISKKKAMQIAQMLSDLFSPVDGARTGGAAVLGDAKLNKVPGLTPADTDLRLLRDQITREIAALWSVPAFLVGAEGDVKYSNHTAQTVALYRDLIAPTAINLGERFSRFLRADVKPKLSAVIAGDWKLAASVADELAGGPCLSVNEVRQAFLMFPRFNDPAADKLRQRRIGDSPPGPRDGEQPTDDGSTDPT